jgi:hypothetical protein
MRWVVLVALAALAGCERTQQAAEAAPFEPWCDELVRSEGHSVAPAAYQIASYDLNGDGPAERIVQTRDGALCGSGGCALFIFTPLGRSWHLVGNATITRPPVRILPETSHGWHDIAVVTGNSIDAQHRRLRFDGRRYPRNPTMPPTSATAPTGGTILIPQT